MTVTLQNVFIKEIEFQNFKRFKNSSIKNLKGGISILAGGNNSGKSSILHGLAVWEFAKLYLENEKGKESLLEDYDGPGLGISYEDFTPINIPSLKYLWWNLNSQGGKYSLKIKCFWDLPDRPDRHLEISLALNQERLFIRNSSSNISADDKIPVVAYLPPFAGVTEREQWYSPADRRKLIGRGLAGAIIRNTIVEMNLDNESKRIKYKGDKKRISKAYLDSLRTTDPYEVLNATLLEVFNVQLFPKKFSPIFHNYVKVDLSKGSLVKNRFKPFPKFNNRDIMVEGSGFLQWLSVYTFALNDSIDILLLDEADAHLHPSLQGLLLDKLKQLNWLSNKQILMASHSPEIIKSTECKSIIEIRGEKVKYLSLDSQKVSLLSGLGTEYSPKINSLQKLKKVIFAENKSDFDILRSWCNVLQLQWPKNLVEWSFANNHKERKQLMHHLKDEITDLKALSLEDRDNQNYKDIKPDLSEANFPDWESSGSILKFRKWRRVEIENYLLCPGAIARTAGVTETDVEQFLLETHSFLIANDYRLSDMTPSNAVLFERDGKSIIETIEAKFKISKFDIAKHMTDAEMCEDPITLIKEIIQFFS